MQKKNTLVALMMIFAMALVLTSCRSCGNRDKNLGSADNPVVISFMPSVNKDVMDKNSRIVTKALEKYSGLTIQPELANKYIVIIDGLASKDIDAAFINSLGYLLARDWSGVEAAFQLKSIDGKTEYKSAIITNANSGIKSLGDINGRSFAYTDPYSMAGYLMPLAMFTEKHIKPLSTSFTHSYDELIERVYSGGVDAGAIYFHSSDPNGKINDARERLIEKHKDLLDKVVIVALSEPIPDTPIVFRKDLPADVKTKLTEAFLKCSEEPDCLAALGKMYNTTGLGPVNDDSFSKIRGVLKTLGKEVEEVVPGGVTFFKEHLWTTVPER